MRIFGKSRVLSILLVAALLLIALGAVHAALRLGDILKVGGIAFLVDRYDQPINDFINKTLGERQAQAKGATKVVPIISLGGGGYIGAAQVLGVPAQVQRTRFVVQVEAKVLGDLRGRVLVPTGKKPEGGQYDRIKGVGVSAVIEFKI
jgi:hypothetical protein